MDMSPSSMDILQMIDEPEIIQDLPLGNFTGGLLEELDVEGERNVNPDRPDYESLKYVIVLCCCFLLLLIVVISLNEYSNVNVTLLCLPCRNAGYFTTEEIIQIHVNKLRKLKTLYQREKELELLTRQHKLRFYKEGLEKLKQFGPKFTTNPYLINRNIDLPKEYIDHQLRQYEAAKTILQTAYKADGGSGLLRLKMIQKAQVGCYFQ